MGNYFDTTATPQKGATCSWDTWSGSSSVPPMAGFGIGLPFSRSYASFAGAKLGLRSRCHSGVDAVLTLDRESLTSAQVEQRRDIADKWHMSTCIADKWHHS